MNTLFSIARMLCVLAVFGWNDSSIFVESYGKGAGQCIGGEVAVGGSHLKAATIKSTTLKAKGVTVSVGGVTIAEGGKGTAKFSTAAITVKGKDMKGVLIRVQGGTPTMTASTGTKVASVCTGNIKGVTHKSSALVSTYTGNVKFAAATKGVLIDISVVFSNGKVAEHAYGRVTVDFTSARL